VKHIREFRLHRQEKFLYICDLLDMWEWELGVMDIQEVTATDAENPLPGRSCAAPPESCGGPRGYRLMLKRQQQGASVSDPALVEATIRESVKKSGVNPPGPRR
jgi:Plasmid pRiA4b ORF-3-like protein